MSQITGLALDIGGRTVVTVTRPLDSDLFPFVLAQNAVSAGVWGIAADGGAYFDPSGAAPGERATLTYDPKSGTVELIR